MSGENAMLRANKKHIMLLVIFFIGLISAGSAGECRFSCELGCNKIGPKPADTDAKGEITFQLDEKNQERIYKLEVREIKGVYMAHLHIGPSSKQGPIAVWLYPPRDNDTEERCIEGEYNETIAEGVIRPEDMKKGVTFNELIEAMRHGNAYVNVHTKQFVPGEIRGQVHPGI